jgi:hypothetical protein
VAFNANYYGDRVRNLDPLPLGVGTPILAMPTPIYVIDITLHRLIASTNGRFGSVWSLRAGRSAHCLVVGSAQENGQGGTETIARYAITARAVRRKDPRYMFPDEDLVHYDLNLYR